MGGQGGRSGEPEQTRAKPVDTGIGPEGASGARIDDYWIIRKLGEGGMGVVYEAEQQHPRRRVALKVLRMGPGMNTGHIALFRREAQALAQLRHRSIASVYATGSTEDDQHFFAMELVHGASLSEYLKDSRNRESFAHGERTKRLRLFLEICDAVNYAHQRGVIHRDLKPSNVIVVNEPVGLPYGILTASIPDIKILDFGLARVTWRNGRRWSEPRGVQGTLTYMSPEQARGRPDEIDIRTDVYSLGVMLYELITGSFPYCICPSRPLEAVRIICEEPPTPLRRLLRGEGLPQIDRDLESIVLKALEKEPARRYQSVLSLAEDIERYLARAPVLARPPSTPYQLRKLVSRHKAGFALLAGFLLLLCISAATLMIERDRARVAERVATAEATKARAVTEFMKEMVWVPEAGQGSPDVKVVDVLEQAAQSVREKFAAQPGIEGDVEAILSSSYLGLGLYDEALEHGERALALRKLALGNSHPDTLDSMYVLAMVLHHRGLLPRAEELARASLVRRARVLGEEHPDTIESVGLLAVILCAEGRRVQAERYFERALADAVASPVQGHWRYHLYQGSYGECLVSLGDYSGAEPLLVESYQGLSSTLGRGDRQAQIALERLVRFYEGWGKGDDLERYRLLHSPP